MAEVVKLDWLSHHKEKKGKYSSIFTLDYNSHNHSIATGGLDGTICIWNVDDRMNLLNSTTMIRHEGSVTMLRWSPDGLLLASVSDDRTMLVWQGDRMIHRLSVGHQADLIALSWSPDGSLLASASIDGVLFIYDCKNGFNVIKMIKGGVNGMLKGISWDPLGVFLACQGDDLVIWRCKDWTVEQRVVDPFFPTRKDGESSVSGGDSTLFKRPSWSPDGRWLCCANGINGLQNAAILLNRNIWNPELSCIGHSGGIEATSFSPIQYDKSGFIIAIGGEDRSVSLWSSNQSHPLIVIHDLFEHNVIDFSWIKENGGSLLACSYDGTVGMIILKEELIGKPQSEEALRELQKNLQKSLFQSSLQNLPSDLIQVKLMDKLEESIQKENKTPNDISSIPTSSIPIITKDGKKRIVPVLVDGKATISTTVASTISNVVNENNLANASLINEGIGGREREIERKSKTIRKIKTKMAISFDDDHLIQVINHPSNNTNSHSSSSSISATNATNLKRISTINMARKSDGSIRWEDQISGPILMVRIENNSNVDNESNDKICCMNLSGDLFLYSIHGRRLLPTLMLGCPPLDMLLKNSHILVILENGQFYHWGHDKIIQKGNIGAISGGISDLDLLDDNSFHFKIEGKRPVSYSPLLECLVDNEEDEDKINEEETDRLNMIMTDSNNNFTEKNATNAIDLLKTILEEGKKERYFPSSLSSIENKLAYKATFSLNQDYNKCAGIYLLKLAREDFIDKAVEFCKYLIQTNRKELLRDLLPLLSQNNGSPSWANLIYELCTLLQ